MEYEEITGKYAPILARMRLAAEAWRADAERLLQLRDNVFEACRLYETSDKGAALRRMRGNATKLRKAADCSMAAAKVARWEHKPVTPARRARAAAIDEAVAEHEKAVALLASRLYDAVALLSALPPNSTERRTAKAEAARLAACIAEAWQEHCKRIIAL